VQGNITGRTETQVSAGGENIEAIRSSEHSQAYRYLRSKATHHDRDGIGAW